MVVDRRHQLPFWLHSRFVLAGSVVLTLLTVALALAFMAYEQRELETVTEARGELYARVLEDQVNRTLAAVDVALGAAAETVQLQRRSSGSSSDAASLSPMLRQPLQALPYLRSISLLDPQGRVLAGTHLASVGRVINRQRLLPGNLANGPGPLLVGHDLTDLAGPDGAATNPVVDNLVPLVRPLGADPKGEWLVATINTDYFANQFQLLLRDTPLRAALMSYDGQLLAATEGLRIAPGQRVVQHRVFSQFLPRLEQGRFTGPGLDGDPTFTAFRTARQQPLVLVVETPEATVLAQLNAISLNLAIGTALLIALVGALGTLAWRSLRSHEQVTGDLRAARGTMAAQHAFTDRLFEVSPIPMFLKDADGRFVRVNKAWSELTGLSSERVLDLNLGRLYPAHLAAPHEVQEQIAIASGLPVAYEEQILDSDGLPRDVMIRVMPFTDAEAQVAGVIGCLMDVTEFREAAQRTLEAKEAAERANTTKSEFLANISHELRTPLQSILGFSELGAARSRSDARQQGMFNDIHGAGERMLTLVNNLLDLSRLESTVGEVQLAPIDIVPPLQAVVQELQQLAGARQLRLLPPVPPAGGMSALWAAADPFRLQQVLRNVLANAIRFAPEGSTITLDWHRASVEELLISVRDHGPGIPDDELESIFGAFVQSSRTKDGSGGTGLGLAICRKIMDAHKGSITARNHPDGGAVFEMRLPALKPRLRAETPAGSRATMSLR